MVTDGRLEVETTSLPNYVEGSSNVAASDGESFAVSLVDIDDDGDLDIFVTNSGSANNFYMNNGDGSFTDVAGKAGVADEHVESRGVAFADTNGDGFLDFYVSDETSSNHLYVGDGQGHFSDATATAGVAAAGKGQGVCFADVDNDGDMDLFVANFGQPNVLFLNNGKGVFADGSDAAGLAADASDSFGCAFGDVDEDGDLDLIVTNDGAVNKLYLNDGKGSFHDDANAAGVEGGTWPKRAVSFADFNGDGHLDLYYVGPMTGLFDCTGCSKLFFGDGKGHFTDVTTEAGVNFGPTWKSAQGMNVADVDSDGDIDIMVSGMISVTHLYLNDGAGHFTDVQDQIGEDPRLGWGGGIAFGDVDNDGDIDVYVANYNGENQLLLNNAQSTKWLKVRPVDENGHANLYGAEVRVYEALGDSQPQVGVRKQVDGGSGFASQNAYDVYFGLSKSNAAQYEIEIRCGGEWIGKGSNPDLGFLDPNQIVKAKCTRSSR